LHALNVTGSGNDTLTLLTPAPIVATTFNGRSGTNTLVGPNVTTTWTISGVNSGKVGNVSFSNFQNLTGGAGSDLFNFTTSTASLSGAINGGGTNNNNTISYATLGSSYLVTATLTSNTTGSATSIGGGFSNINYLIGSADTANTLTGPNSTNAWIITGNNTGDVYTGPVRPFAFTGIGHLVGGTGVDTFRFDSTSDKVLSINGGGAPSGQGDWLKYSLFPSSSTVTVNLATGSATNVNGGAAGAVTNIQNVLGSATGTNILTGDAQGNILIGGSGANTIVGGSGNSLLIGGSGHGSITGGSGQDILIAGTMTDNPLSTAGVDSLMAILAELQSADTFAQKVYDLIHGTDSGDPNGHGSDLNGTNKLTWGGTVRASTGTFTLSGDTSASSNPDWFFSNSPSTVTDFNHDGVQDEHNNNAIGVF
jgi:Ca2+-binding RTX toxin-like protein